MIRLTKKTFEYAHKLRKKKLSQYVVEEAEHLLEADPKLFETLSDPAVPPSKKYALIESRFHSQIRDFMSKLCLNGDMALFPEIARTYCEIPLDHDDPFQVTIFYVTPPTDEQFERIQQFVYYKFNRRDTVFELQEDKSLVGGFRLLAGNHEDDWSLKGRLDQLTRTLREYQHRPGAAARSSVEEIRRQLEAWDNSPEKSEPNAVNPVTERLLHENLALLRAEINEFELSADNKEVGVVDWVGDGIANIRGIEHAMYGEILLFESGVRGMVQDIRKDDIGCILFGPDTEISAGSRVSRTEKLAGIPVGSAFLGRVVDALGSPIDSDLPIITDEYRPVECPAPGIVDRQSVNESLETGILSIDSMFPIGRGQRELIIGDRQTGKTSIAVDTILNQRGKDVICIYVAIGQKASTVAKIVSTFKKHHAMDYTTVVCASAGDPAPLQFIAPYAGTALAEYFMYAGKDVLIVYDDLSKHAVAYRALSLLLKRAPGREAYPGDVFYLHSRLLERASHLSEDLGGGSLTALPIVETQAGDVSAYIPTNVISITDGQIFLESSLFFSGMRPAVNVGLSVSRVGRAAQTKAMKKASGSIRLSLAQYREMEVFTQFSSELDASTKELLQYGRGLMELLKQPLCQPLSLHQQVITLCVAVGKVMLPLPPEKIKDFQMQLLAHFDDKYPEIGREIEIQKTLDDDLENRILSLATEFRDLVFDR